MVCNYLISPTNKLAPNICLFQDIIFYLSFQIETDLLVGEKTAANQSLNGDASAENCQAVDIDGAGSFMAENNVAVQTQTKTKGKTGKLNDEDGFQQSSGMYCKY